MRAENKVGVDDPDRPWTARGAGRTARVRPGGARRSLVVVAALALLCWPTSASADTTVQAKLVEQNNSGVSGAAALTVTDDGGLRVVIRAQGLIPGQPHAQHLHGTTSGAHFACATVEQNDRDGDGVLTNEEASGEYGTIFLPLTTRGGVAPEDGLDTKRMPRADQSGRLSYDRTIPAADLPEGLVRHLASLHVVQHGIDANDNGRYDVDALGVSTFAESLGAEGIPEEETNPASCGVVTGAGAAHPARKGIETGGTPPAPVDLPLVASGIALLLLAAGLLLPVRRRRPSPVTGDEHPPA
jgi:hypothetical protein